MNKNNENNNLNNEPGNFGLPKGYFQNSANSIFNKIEWIEEHKEFPALNNLKKESGFSVPKNYFNENESKLELVNYPTLFSLNKLNNFKTPANYFEETEIVQLSVLLQDNENELNAFEKLNAISRQNNFKVSDTYFSSSAEKITADLLEDKKEAKVIKLFSAKIWYAAAATITITLGLWIYTQYFKVAAVGDCGTLACVDKIDLVKTKNLESLDNEQLYELVDTKKLEEKLEDKTGTVKTKKENKKDQDTILKNVSTDELLDEI